MLPIAGQTAGLNGLTFFVDLYQFKNVEDIVVLKSV